MGCVNLVTWGCHELDLCEVNVAVMTQRATAWDKIFDKTVLVFQLVIVVVIEMRLSK